MNQIDHPLSERQAAILHRIERAGFATIDELAHEHGVSAQTVRRDIIALDGMGLLQRFHGGAGTNHSGAQIRLAQNSKASIDVDAKERIAEAVTARIPDGAAIYIDVGTTMEATARALNARGGMLVFTNSMRVASALDFERHDVRLLGGRVAGLDGSLTGEEIVLALSGLTLDIALVGCSAIDRTGRVMDFDFGKIAVKRTAMRAARTSFLLASSSKFDRTARCEFARVGDFAEVFSGTGAEAATG